MPVERKSFTVAPEQSEWVEAQVASGSYGSSSEYIRDLIRRDMLAKEKERELRDILQAAIDSGVSEETTEQIRARVLKKMKANGGL